MDKITNCINLERLAEGAFAEKLNEAINKVAENIQDPNTEPTTVRGITVNLKFKPNKNRHMVAVSITTTTKLAAAEAVGTVMLMGTNARTGQIEISEYFDQLAGQVSINDMEEIEEESEEIEEPEQVQAPGKPLDLRNRRKQPEEQSGSDTGRVVNINDKAVQA